LETITVPRDHAARPLANVNPVFYWVRLAQRIPVRIHIDHVPEGVFLAAGATCTVTVNHEQQR
jgi:multidrug resistance efflux pump